MMQVRKNKNLPKYNPYPMNYTSRMQMLKIKKIFVKSNKENKELLFYGWLHLAKTCKGRVRRLICKY